MQTPIYFNISAQPQSTLPKDSQSTQSCVHSIYYCIHSNLLICETLVLVHGRPRQPRHRDRERIIHQTYLGPTFCTRASRDGLSAEVAGNVGGVVGND